MRFADRLSHPSSSLPMLFPALFVALLAACGGLLSACGGGGSSSPPPFAVLPPLGPGTPEPTDPVIPPPTAPQTAIWQPDAATLGRTPLFGAFPSDLVRYGSTLFLVDADQIEADGARILAFDASDASLVLDPAFAPTTLLPSHLRDAIGRPADPVNPIGFGFYVNEIEIATANLGFALVNAGGSDSSPPLSNVIAFNPTTGAILDIYNLATLFASSSDLFDSEGAPVPGNSFMQSQAEAMAYLPTGPTTGRLFVGMANIVVGFPSFGATKLPGTMQVLHVQQGGAPLFSTVPDPQGLLTQTVATGRFNPVSIDVLGGTSLFGAPRILVTLGGASEFDASFQLIPATDAAVEVYDGDSAAFLGRFEMGLAALVSRPAFGRDAAGHQLGFFPSGITGQIYVLRLDGLFGPVIVPSQLAVLRGPHNGIAIDGPIGSPGGNIASVGLSPDGRILAVSGFGDLFAGRPGRLLLLALPADLVGNPAFGASFQPGVTEFASVLGRTMGPLVVHAHGTHAPEIYVAVGGAIGDNGLGAGPASIGTLQTFGLVR